jgi:seryl-tRNA(Sec) selenium transferase
MWIAQSIPLLFSYSLGTKRIQSFGCTISYTAKHGVSDFATEMYTISLVLFSTDKFMDGAYFM